MSRRGWTPAGALTLALLLGACTSDNGTGPTPSETVTPSTVPTTTPSPEPTVTSSPTGIPLVEPVKVSHGKATLHVTGGFKLDLDLPLGRNGVYQPNPGSFSLSFVARDGNGLLVGGSTPLGSAKTSSDLTLSFVLQGKHAYAFPSAEGECTIDVTHAGPKSFSATFSCKPLKAEGKTITARGTFEASA